VASDYASRRGGHCGVATQARARTFYGRAASQHADAPTTRSTSTRSRSSTPAQPPRTDWRRPANVSLRRDPGPRCCRVSRWLLRNSKALGERHTSARAHTTPNGMADPNWTHSSVRLPPGLYREGLCSSHRAFRHPPALTSCVYDRPHCARIVARRGMPWFPALDLASLSDRGRDDREAGRD